MANFLFFWGGGRPALNFFSGHFGFTQSSPQISLLTLPIECFHCRYNAYLQGLYIKVKVPTFIYCYLQRFTIRSGLLASTSSRRRRAISGRPLPNQTNFEPTVAARQLCPSQPHCGLHPAMFSGNNSLYLYFVYDFYIK